MGIYAITGFIQYDRDCCRSQSSESERTAGGLTVVPTEGTVRQQGYRALSRRCPENLIRGPNSARELGIHAVLHHFIHIPWPTPHYWTFRPQDIRQAICSGLAANDSVGFQTPESVGNFLQSCAQFVPGARVDLAASTVTIREHVCAVGSYPISVDVTGLRRLAAGKLT